MTNKIETTENLNDKRTEHLQLGSSVSSTNTTTAFKFDSFVANAFDDMAARSIPGYFTTQILSTNLCKQHYKKGTRIYDIGSATGTTILMLMENLQDQDIEIIGIEPSSPMAEISLKKIQSFIRRHPSGLNQQVNITCTKLEDTVLSNASCIICNYTLHFINCDLRRLILSQIYEALVPKGFVILSEKTITINHIDNERIDNEYKRFKELNGYSKNEILNKEKTLKGVLTPLTLDENIKLMVQAGFKKVEVAFQAPPFATLIGWK
jgi:tRNA (cmo5U34)-methyltransferase